jgi:transcription initiation factor TFIID subunit 5
MDGSLVVGGFADSSIRVWDLLDRNHNSDRDSNQTFPAPSHRPLPSLTLPALSSSPSSSSASSMPAAPSSSRRGYVSLIGHSGPAYGCSLSPDSSFLLSCSEDANIRLWHLPTAANLVAYKGHTFPVWDVAFSPLGYHFASAAQSQHIAHRQCSCSRLTPASSCCKPGIHRSSIHRLPLSAVIVRLAAIERRACGPPIEFIL